MSNTPLDLNLFTIFVGGAAGVAMLTATCVVFIQAGFRKLEATFYRVTAIQRKEIDKILNDHGMRIMRAELKLFGWSVEGAMDAKSENHSYE